MEFDWRSIYKSIIYLQIYSWESAVAILAIFLKTFLSLIENTFVQCRYILYLSAM